MDFIQSLQKFFSLHWVKWVGFRYLRSKKSSRFLNFITLLSVIGVGLGVTAMVVVLSVMDGFEIELKKRLMSSDLHVLLQPKAEAPGFDQGVVPDDALSKTEAGSMLERDSRVVNIWPVLATEAIARSGRKVTGIVLKGVTAKRIESMQSTIVESAEPQMLVEGEGAEAVRLPGVIVGQELAYMMGLIPGDRLTVISPIETQGPLGSVPRVMRFAVEGVYRSGLPEQELHQVFTKIQSVQAFLRKKNVVTEWEIAVKNFDEATSIANDIRPYAPQFRVRDWIEMNSSLFSSLKLERIAMFIILAFIVVVASFNIVTTLTMMVLEKRRDVAILKTMGASRSEIGAIFLSEGLWIGGVGVVGGTALAFVICVLLKRYQFISLPDFYYDRTLPVAFDVWYFLGVALCAFVIVLAACVYPARRASALHPLDGLRG